MLNYLHWIHFIYGTFRRAFSWNDWRRWDDDNFCCDFVSFIFVMQRKRDSINSVNSDFAINPLTPLPFQTEPAHYSQIQSVHNVHSWTFKISEKLWFRSSFFFCRKMLETNTAKCIVNMRRASTIIVWKQTSLLIKIIMKWFRVPIWLKACTGAHKLNFITNLRFRWCWWIAWARIRINISRIFGWT